MSYNITSSWDLTTTLISVNQQANGWLITLFLLALWLIIFVATKNYETKRAFTVASFITLIISTIFTILGLTNLYYTLVALVLTIVGFIAMKAEDG